MKILVTSLLLIALVSCESIEYGNVINKTYSPEYTTHLVIIVPMRFGKSTSYLPIPYTIHHSASWSIEVEGKTKKGNDLTKRFYVTKDKFDSLKIGQFICVTGFCENDTSITKKRE